MSSPPRAPAACLTPPAVAELFEKLPVFRLRETPGTNRRGCRCSVSPARRGAQGSDIQGILVGRAAGRRRISSPSALRAAPGWPTRPSTSRRRSRHRLPPCAGRGQSGPEPPIPSGAVASSRMSRTGTASCGGGRRFRAPPDSVRHACDAPPHPGAERLDAVPRRRGLWRSRGSPTATWDGDRAEATSRCSTYVGVPLRRSCR